MLGYNVRYWVRGSIKIELVVLRDLVSFDTCPLM